MILFFLSCNNLVIVMSLTTLHSDHYSSIFIFLNSVDIYYLRRSTKLFYLHSLLQKKEKIPQKQDLIRYGYVNLLKRRNLSFDIHDMNLASSHGHIKVIEYLREKNCTWNKSTCNTAAENGHLITLKFLRGGFMKKVPRGGKSPDTCPIDKGICNYAAKSGNLELLKYCQANGYNFGAQTILRAVTSGKLNIVKYLHQNGCELYPSLCGNSIIFGHVHVLQYLIENGCEITKDDFYEAIKHGYIHILQYLFKHIKLYDGNDIQSELCRYATSLEMLKYLIENGCCIDKSTFNCAVIYNNLDILQYLKINNCPYDKNVCLLNTNDEKVREWIKNNLD